MPGADCTAALTPPLLIAHRGASRDVPENTLAAFARAWHEGADGIEADFRLTRDGRIVCLHDATTGRTAAVNLEVAAASFAELRRLDVGAWKRASWQGERIPLLEEVLAQLPAAKMLFIELKSGPEIIAPLRSVLAASRVAAEQLRLLAFDLQLVSRLKAELPDYRVCLNVDYHRGLPYFKRPPAPEEILATLAQCHADGLSCRAQPLLDAQTVSALRRNGKEIHVWTIDAVRTAEHYRQLGVDSIMTNRPGWLRHGLLPADNHQRRVP